MYVVFVVYDLLVEMFSSLLTVTLANALHPGANGTSAGLAIMFPHQLAGQPFRPV